MGGPRFTHACWGAVGGGPLGPLFLHLGLWWLSVRSGGIGFPPHTGGRGHLGPRFGGGGLDLLPLRAHVLGLQLLTCSQREPVEAASRCAARSVRFRHFSSLAEHLCRVPSDSSSGLR